MSYAPAPEAAATAYSSGPVAPAAYPETKVGTTPNSTPSPARSPSRPLARDIAHSSHRQYRTDRMGSSILVR